MLSDNELFDQLLRTGVPSCAPSFALPAIERRWSGQGTPPLKPPTRSFELFDDVLPEAEEHFIQRRSRSAFRGWQAKFPSKRMQRTMMARSHLELRLLEICEVDARVERFVEQPLCVFYVDGDGRLRRYVPDLFLDSMGERKLVEVKWERDAREPKNEARWPWIAQAINGLGFTFEVLTERHILNQPRADNVIKLLRYRRADPLDDRHRNALIEALTYGPLSMADVRSIWPDLPPASLYRALTDGWLWTDLSREIEETSPLHLAASPRRAPCS